MSAIRMAVRISNDNVKESAEHSEVVAARSPLSWERGRGRIADNSRSVSLPPVVGYNADKYNPTSLKTVQDLCVLPFWRRQERLMQLGFIGTGEITSSIVTGLNSSGVTAHTIWLSPRNSAIANGLVNRFRGISVASCNQEVLDHCDTIVIAVRPSAARDVLAELRFRPDHQVISLVSALSLRSLSELAAPAVRIARAVPLPSTAKRLSPTAIYPPRSGRR